MKYQYRATEKFWSIFYQLNPRQKDSCRKAWQIFKEDPFDPRLGEHRIHRLFARYGKTIYSIVLEADLRLLFYVEGQTVTSIIVGSHKIYEG